MAGSTARAHCQLYLVMEVHAATRDHLDALLARGPIASVLFRPKAGAVLSAQVLKPLVERAQDKNVAALLLDDAALARTLRADGVHLSASADILSRYEEARSILGTRAIVGADAGGSRHVAMELGEAGADYVAFSEDRSLLTAVGVGDDDERPEDLPGPLDQRDLIGWWSDMFEVPCVAFDVGDVEAARDMATAGADFVAVTHPVATQSATVAHWFDNVRRAVELAHA